MANNLDTNGLEIKSFNEIKSDLTTGLGNIYGNFLFLYL